MSLNVVKKIFVSSQFVHICTFYTLRDLSRDITFWPIIILILLIENTQKNTSLSLFYIEIKNVHIGKIYLIFYVCYNYTVNK